MYTSLARRSSIETAPLEKRRETKAQIAIRVKAQAKAARLATAKATKASVRAAKASQRAAVVAAAAVARVAAASSRAAVRESSVVVAAQRTASAASVARVSASSVARVSASSVAAARASAAASGDASIRATAVVTASTISPPVLATSRGTTTSTRASLVLVPSATPADLANLSAAQIAAVRLAAKAVRCGSDAACANAYSAAGIALIANGAIVCNLGTRRCVNGTSLLQLASLDVTNRSAPGCASGFNFSPDGRSCIAAITNCGAGVRFLNSSRRELTNPRPAGPFKMDTTLARGTTSALPVRAHASDPTLTNNFQDCDETSGFSLASVNGVPSCVNFRTDANFCGGVRPRPGYQIGTNVNSANDSLRRLVQRRWYSRVQERPVLARLPRWVRREDDQGRRTHLLRLSVCNDHTIEV